ncbi:uncharacterized protein LOC143913922 isoform X1 [Arctopsyche grandis]|uniref:uncharacterized protein LOC143913922 isoform X1 n=1 Tax=Arctopsyche grandis TaxID=121162 RepID=UPI00406D7F47
MMECRLCLRPAPLESSTNVHDDSDSLLKRVQSCCRLYMKECEDVPDRICSLCESYLESLIDFKTICAKNDKIARLKLGKRSDVKVEETILDDLVWDDENYNTNTIDSTEDSIGLLNKNQYGGSFINEQNSMEGKYSQCQLSSFNQSKNYHIGFPTNCTLKINEKRTIQKETWKKEQDRRRRYSSTSLPVHPTCGHNTKGYRCGTLSMPDLLELHKQFYKNTSKLWQDNYILSHSQAVSCKRRKSRMKNIKRSVSVKYYVFQKSTGVQVPVCKKAFMSIFGIKKDRIIGVIKRSYNNCGSVVGESRGGDHRSKSYETKRNAVHDFIQSLKGSHCCRSESTSPVELNTKDMWRMYNNQTPDDALKVKESFFRKEFKAMSQNA